MTNSLTQEDKLDQHVKLELVRESARHSFFGAFVYPTLFLTICLFSDLAPPKPVAILIMLTLLVAGILRLRTGGKALTASADSIHRQKWQLRLFTMTQVVVWCLFSSFTIYNLGQDNLCTLTFLTIASGLAAGGTFSLAPDRVLAATYMACIYVTHAPHCWFFAESTTFVAATIQATYCAIQIHVQNRRLDRYFRNNERLRLRTEDLETANQLSRQAQETAEEASKAKGEFVATMSHEIRTPLHGVLGSNTLLLDSSLSEEQREYAEMIKNSGEALLAVIDDILDLSKLEAGFGNCEKSTFNLPELLGKCQVVVNQRIREKKLILKTSQHESVPRFVRGNANNLRQVLLNLLSNAVKFTDQGHVELKVSTQESEEGSPWLVFQVLDTGVGIPEAFKRDLFEPFRQATRTQGGTGLGLAISARLAEVMGGVLTAQDRPGGGSCFTLKIPLEAAQEMVVAPEPVRLNQPKKSTNRILIVEDNATSRKLLERLLSKVGIQCDVAVDGQQGVDAVLGQTTYNLILMDCHMPVMDGFEASVQIREHLAEKAPPIVAITANVSQQDQKRCRESGMVGFLSKPIRLTALQEILDQHLD